MNDIGMGVIRLGDGIALLIYLACTLGLGIWIGTKTKTTEGYFLGGRKMPGWAIAASFLGTMVSSITFLAFPGSSFDGNYSRYSPALAFPLGAIAAVFIFVPFYRKTGYISAYTYIERRFGLWGRVYVCIMFSIAQIWRMGLILYLLSMAISNMHPKLELYIVILFIGVFVAIYSVLGGIEAVIWTDVLQSAFLILGGLAVVTFACTHIEGGMGTIMQMGAANGKFSIIGKNVKSVFDLSLARETFLVLFLYGAMNSIVEHALHQTHVQRYCAASSCRGAQAAVLLGALSCLPVWLLFMFLGTCLWVFYQLNPGQMNHEMLADQVFPYFILTQLPSGIGGLVIAGILAAAMSSIDSCINSTTTVITEDIYKRILVRTRADSHYLKAAKTIATGSASIMILIAFALTQMRQETILEIIFVMSAILAGGLGGLFLIGFFTLRANNFGAIIGIVISILLTCGMTFVEARALIWESKVSWLVQDAVEEGIIDPATLKSEIIAEAEARGKSMKPSDIEREKNKRLREALAPRIMTELGAAPPHLADAFGIHTFLIGVISNLAAFVFGYLFSYLRPSKSLAELNGLTWHTRHT